MWYVSAMIHRSQVIIGDRGRLVLPSSVRAELGLTSGTRMLLSTEDDGSLRLRPFRAVADESRGLFIEAAQDRSLVDELTASRRDEADREA
jgi:AbrB family looped-hinge helix DNA binding protein